jgi:ketosteroid isomerase-like protein
MPDTNVTIQTVASQWIHAETSGDITELQRLLDENFAGVGPAGFVLQKKDWIERYNNGLQNDTFTLTDLQVREYGHFAVGIGVQVQTGSFQGRTIDGKFRVTLIFRKDNNGWLLSGTHLSAIRE